MKRSADAMIRQALAEGVLTVNLDSGQVWRHGKLATETNGRYLWVFVRDSRRALVHRVVWIAAHGHIPAGMEVNHKNGERLDNRLANLEVVTRRENVRKHYTGVATYHPRLADLSDADPELVARAQALAAASPSRTDIAEFLAAYRDTREN